MDSVDEIYGVLPVNQARSRNARDRLLQAGERGFAKLGYDAAHVSDIAQAANCSVGSFYRRFRDRAALLEGMLDAWRTGRIAAIEQQATLKGESARDRLKALIRLYSERTNTEGMAIELAIRQWARSDQTAAEAVASVDAARLKNVGQLFRATGLEADAADAKAFLFYCFIFGQSLLFLESGQRKRAQLIVRSAETLLDEG